MLKIETSLFGASIRDSTSNGMSSMLMNIQMNQRRENSTKTLVSMLKDHSMLFQNCHLTDTLTSLITEDLQSRLQMEETPRSGTSINSP